ncbi:hypothetical protein Taro_023865 [Colocasia esculenta]|uniref:Uncharacterized protein n=1 Tax=Colocasia esculenta TaxID=4460 RepID=A0A843V9M1_COLES|nr:hypothetical protein [Colocasia esculenta]
MGIYSPMDPRDPLEFGGKKIPAQKPSTKTIHVSQNFRFGKIVELCRHTLHLCRHTMHWLQNGLLGGAVSVDTQSSCVDTTGHWLHNKLLGGIVTVDTQSSCVDTTGHYFLHCLLDAWDVLTPLNMCRHSWLAFMYFALGLSHVSTHYLNCVDTTVIMGIFL